MTYLTKKTHLIFNLNKNFYQIKPFRIDSTFGEEKTGE
jgi:hypothetical protein